MRLLHAVLWCAVVGTAAGVVVLASLEPHDQYFDAKVLLGAARAVLAGETPYGGYFQSPLWTALLLVPFAALPAGAGHLAWFWANVACWVAATLLLFRAIQWPLTWPGRAAAVSFLVLYAPVMWAIHGQVIGLMALGLALFLLLERRRPFAAGAALALLLVKPHLALFPFAVFLVAALRARRWRVPLGLATAAGLLAAASVLVQPAWAFQWFDAVLHPPPEIVRDRALYAPTVTAFTGLWAPGWLASALGWAAGVLAGIAVLRWVWREQPASATVLVALAVPALFLVSPYSQGYDLSLLVFPLAILAPCAFGPYQDLRSAVSPALLVGAYLFPVLVVITDWPQPVLVMCPVLALLSLASGMRNEAYGQVRGMRYEV